MRYWKARVMEKDGVPDIGVVTEGWGDGGLK